MADVKSLEHPTLKVPYEILNKKFRAAQKTLDREVSHVQQNVSEVEKCLSSEDGIKAKEITNILGGMVEKLTVLKRKAEESISEELAASNVCKRRLEHLKEHASVTSSSNASTGTLNQWRRKRLDRMVVEYFLRNGFYNSAIMLANRSDIKDYTNIDIFLTSREVEKSLANHETQKCLLWCHDNKSKLRKLKSNMEFNLRVQEFIEMIRKDRRIDAIKHARKHFPGFEEEHLPTIQKVMALLAFSVDTAISPYAALLNKSRWDDLIEQFRQENYRLFQLASQSVFTVTLQAGLSALKTPQCYSDNNENRNPACPVCQEDLNKLAEHLPFAHCSQSRLYCHITGLPLNENNQPMMLPNGYIYGEQVPITQPDADEYPPLQYQMNLLHCSGNSGIHGNGYYYDFKSANFIDINNYLGSIPWEDLLSGGTADEMTNMLYDALTVMAKENNGQVICPKTKEIFPFKKVDKVFVM